MEPDVTTYNRSVDTPIPAQVRKFREEIRATRYRPHYVGWAHFAFTSVASLSVIALAISQLSAVTPLEWLTVPFSFLVANATEYFGHKGPMHRLRPRLRLIFRRHTQEHHHFFTSDCMAYESTRDFRMVLFPPVMLFFFLGVIATPVAGLFFLLFSRNAGWLFVATGIGYYLCYEWLHFCYHLPETSWVGRLPFMAALRRHHTFHHDLALMGKWNFNITFPICDRLFGTTYERPPSGN